MHVCAFTGHRPERFIFKYDEKHPLCYEIKKAIQDECPSLYETEEVKTFLVGCALGVDLWSAEAVLQLRDTYSDINLVCAIPYPNHTEKWTFEQKQRLNKIMQVASNVIIVSDGYSNDVYKARNYFMVDKAQYLIAIFDYEKNMRSGTMQTVNYAKKKKLKIIYIHPDTAKITKK